MAQDPDPAQRGQAVQRQRGDQPAIECQGLPSNLRGKGGRSLLEQNLAQADAEHTQQSEDNGKFRHPGAIASGREPAVKPVAQ